MSRAPEIERRWIVERIDPKLRQRSKTVYVGHIQQGYQDESGSTRVRLTTPPTPSGWRAEFTSKLGFGEERIEENHPLPPDAGLNMFLHSPYAIHKQRYLLDDWEIDYYREQLSGLVVLERELPQVGTPVSLPSWVEKATEVTNRVSNSLLAVLAQDMQPANSPEHAAEMAWLMQRLLHPPKRIIVTGGPCSGKSTAIHAANKAMPGAFHLVPEVATIVIGQVNAPPFDAAERLMNRQFNRSMCGIQKHFERMALLQAFRNGTRNLLIDRGVIDNAGYIAEGIRGLENACHTSRQLEYSRYGVVIYIEMPCEEVFYRCKGGNAKRQENSYEQAQQFGRTVLDCWSEHPNLIRIPDFPTWNEKQAAIVDAIRANMN